MSVAILCGMNVRQRNPTPVSADCQWQTTVLPCAIQRALSCLGIVLCLTSTLAVRPVTLRADDRGAAATPSQRSIPSQRSSSLQAAATSAAAASDLEGRFFSKPVQITDGMTKAGEGYFSPDASRICYQAVPLGYPFYQIFTQPIALDQPRPAMSSRVSPGRGRTTCSWFAPGGDRLLFASSHLDPAIDDTEAEARRQAEEDARSGRRRRYAWDFDPWTEIFTANLDGSDLVRLTDSPGYDAECSFSPDGSEILFVSDRDGDPDIYLMKADGTDVRQLTDEPGYDGGPFFSPDGRWIAYRTDRVEKDLLHIHVMRADGAADLAVTTGQSVEWAPYWHPSRPWLVWTGADHSDPSARPNYDLWVARYSVDDGDVSRIRFGQPVRITDHPSADVLPVIAPDGEHLLWTSGRSADRSSQLWLARLDIEAIEAALDAADERPQGGDAVPPSEASP
jgi:TolB protein